MNDFRNHPPTTLNGLKVTEIEDYQRGVSYHMIDNTTQNITLPKANVIRVKFKEGFIALRPSGTEPKIKLYVSLQCNHFENMAQAINDIIFKDII